MTLFNLVVVPPPSLACLTSIVGYELGQIRGHRISRISLNPVFPLASCLALLLLLGVIYTFNDITNTESLFGYS